MKMHYKSTAPSKSKLYLAWINVKTRCQSTSYKMKNITHPASWNTFQGFISEMGDGYTEGLYLLRKDVEAPFTKSNCFWGTRTEMKRKPRTNGSLKSEGVYRCLDYNGNNVYRAYWNDPTTGKRKYKGYSESKYGGIALRLALEYRAKVVQNQNS